LNVDEILIFGNYRMDGMDITTIVIYLLLIYVYSSKITSRRGAAAVVGFTTLILSKKYEDSRPDIAKYMKAAGYAVLILSPSYDHWFDVLGAAGYSAMAMGIDVLGEPNLAIYDLYAALNATSPLYMFARASLAVAMSLEIDNPLIPHQRP
jgi:hypothetical protein